MNSSQRLKALQWMAAAMLAAVLMYVAFRAYLAPDFLLGFANLFVC